MPPGEEMFMYHGYSGPCPSPPKQAEQETKPVSEEATVVTTTAQDWEGPKTLDEASCYHQGFIGGLTAYAREKGDSTLKSANELLRRMMDEQGWKTVETLERLSETGL